MARKKKVENDPGAVARLVSTEGMPDASKVAAYLKEIADLKAQLDLKDEQLSDAKKREFDAAVAQASFQQSSMQEVPTGKTVKVQKLDPDNQYKTVGYKDDGRPILKPNFITVDVPTYAYKIDIPPMAGWDMKVNGLPIVHGATYEFDLGTLQSIKDMVYRAWQHEAVTSGNQNENLFRKPQERRIGSRA